MTSITLTRAYSGFRNVEDEWIIGEDDSVAGTVGTYKLPDGYEIAENKLGGPGVFGPDGYMCTIGTAIGGSNPALFGTPDKAIVLFEADE